MRGSKVGMRKIFLHHPQAEKHLEVLRHEVSEPAWEMLATAVAEWRGRGASAIFICYKAQEVEMVFASKPDADLDLRRQAMEHLKRDGCSVLMAVTENGHRRILVIPGTGDADLAVG